MAKAYNFTFAVAMPNADLKGLGLDGSVNGSFYNDLSNLLDKYGLKMIGDYIDSEDVTDEWDNIYTDEGGLDALWDSLTVKTDESLEIDTDDGEDVKPPEEDEDTEILTEKGKKK